MSLSCAPNVNVANHYTCFDDDELRQIALAFNIFIQSNKVCSIDTAICVPSKVIKIENTSKRQLWKAIYNRLNKICKYESCWANQDFISSIPDKNLQDKIRLFTFKPQMPKTKRAWLSTNDINTVLQQYQEMDTSFKFLGALPSDFYTQIKVTYTDIQLYKKVGVVLNHDTHDEPGSHWVALLIDNVRRTIEYFDSAGNPPNRMIRGFINKVRQTLPSGYTYLENTVVHQKQNSECGVYAVYYIIQRLLGKSFREISHYVIRDKAMNIFRQYIFRSV